MENVVESPYMTIAVPRDEAFDYPLLHALARANKMPLGAFIRHAVEEHYREEIAAHLLFAKTVAQKQQSLHKGDDGSA